MLYFFESKIPAGVYGVICLFATTFWTKFFTASQAYSLLIKKDFIILIPMLILIFILYTIL